MTNAMMVLLITAAILAQVGAIGLFGWLRQRARLRALERQVAGGAGASVRAAASDRDRDAVAATVTFSRP